MRLIIDQPGAPARNMAVDEAMLDTLAAGAPASMPTLRFYRWRQPTISLGYFQPIDVYDRWLTGQDGQAERLGLVRRATGGGAILHADELTYSLAVPGDCPAIARDPTNLYRLAHQAIAAALNALGVPAGLHDGPCAGNAQRGPFFCFARRHCHDLVVGGEKIVGSAQRRKRGPARAILQHGSIILARVGPQPCIGVNDCRPAAITAEELTGLLIPGFETVLGTNLAAGLLTDAEQAAADQIETKYASAEWTRQR